MFWLRNKKIKFSLRKRQCSSPGPYTKDFDMVCHQLRNSIMLQLRSIARLAYNLCPESRLVITFAISLDPKQVDQNVELAHCLTLMVFLKELSKS